jgi:hypothetical protein
MGGVAIFYHTAQRMRFEFLDGQHVAQFSETVTVFDSV